MRALITCRKRRDQRTPNSSSAPIAVGDFSIIGTVVNAADVVPVAALI